MSENHPIPGSALRRLPSLDMVRGFEAAARHLSFTRAGGELALTQSAISRQIRALEEALGAPLFVRMNRRLELTEDGRRFARAVSEALGLIDAAAREIASHSAREPVTVTTTMSFASLWLVPRLAAFRQRHPDVDVRIVADDAVLDPRVHRVDLAIRFCAPGAAPADAVALFDESVIPVCSPGLLSDPARPLREPSDLAEHVLLALATVQSDMAWLDWAPWLVALGVPSLRPAGVLSFTNYSQMIQAAIDGAGVALARLPLLERSISRGELVAPFGHRQALPRQYWLVGTGGSDPRVAALRAWLLDEAIGAGAASAGDDHED
ncbi:MAG: LysR family transcriptional regulator [Gemmatimonadales bacterium]|nr:LysR family transcriptional regulator [Gemmatimonadales bacterium]